MSLLQVFGHRDVSVLNGGLQHWKGSQYPVETGVPHTPRSQTYSAQCNTALVRTLEQVSQSLESGAVQVG
jgi:thiosulfate/3-mercaptopyruvate sulfurtransferase